MKHNLALGTALSVFATLLPSTATAQVAGDPAPAGELVPQEEKRDAVTHLILDLNETGSPNDECR